MDTDMEMVIVLMKHHNTELKDDVWMVKHYNSNWK